jgi:hypothetical protein
VVLAAVDSQLSVPPVGHIAWRVTEGRRLIDKGGNELERYEQEWVASEPPLLKGIGRDTLELFGYSWLADSRWFFALPHPATFANREFERLHCFRTMRAHADSIEEIQFVPTMRRMPQQLAGRVVFGGEPITIQRMDLFYRGVPREFGDSIANASMRFEPSNGGRVRLNGWRVSTPARLPYDTVQSVLAPQYRPNPPTRCSCRIHGCLSRGFRCGTVTRRGRRLPRAQAGGRITLPHLVSGAVPHAWHYIGT